MSSWDANPAPEREWAVENRIPMYQPHLTTGHGAIGKSLLELTRAVAHVLGKPWLGMAVRQGPVIYLGAEDEADELHRRLEAIVRHYGATFGDIVGGLTFCPMWARIAFSVSLTTGASFDRPIFFIDF